MAGTDFIFNIALGRPVELFKRVLAANPVNSAILLVALDSTGLETDAVLRDKDTLAAVLSGTTNEASNTGYERVSLVAADLNADAPDDSGDVFDLTLDEQTVSGVQAGSNWGKVLVCYHPDTVGGTDSDVIPMFAYNVTVNPDGNPIVLQALTGLFRASE